MNIWGNEDIDVEVAIARIRAKKTIAEGVDNEAIAEAVELLMSTEEQTIDISEDDFNIFLKEARDSRDKEHG